MRPWIEEKFANPHSPSRWGREAAAAIEVARNQVEQAIGLDGGSVAFTGSATEALNWALKGTVENAPTRPQPDRHRRDRACRGARYAASGSTGSGIDVDRPAGRARRAGRPRPARSASSTSGSLLVAVMLVNNEIGVIQPIAEIAAHGARGGALMLCDAVQGLGRVDDSRRARPGRGLGAQDPRAQGDRRLVDARRAPSRRR